MESKLESFNHRMTFDGKRNNREVEITCDYCGEKSWQRWQRVKKKLENGEHFFCSRECTNEWQREQGSEHEGKENARFHWDGNRWIAQWWEDGKLKNTSKARWLWEQNYGEIVGDYWVVHKDRNPENCELNNLELVSRGERMSEALMGHEVSEETKQKISDAHSGKILSEEHKNKIGLATKQRWEDGTFDAPEIRDAYVRAGKSTKGKKWTNEQREKISKQRKGKIPTQLHTFEVRAKVAKSLRGKTQTKESNLKRSLTLRGREFTSEHRENLSVASKQRTDLQGENSIWWRGGTWENPYPPEFNRYLKQKIRRRDNHECQGCGENVYRSKRGHVHHIDGNKQNCGEENLILLCITCHNAVHGRTTLSNENIEFLRSMLKY